MKCSLLLSYRESERWGVRREAEEDPWISQHPSGQPPASGPPQQTPCPGQPAQPGRPAAAGPDLRRARLQELCSQVRRVSLLSHSFIHFHIPSLTVQRVNIWQLNSRELTKVQITIATVVAPIAADWVFTLLQKLFTAFKRHILRCKENFLWRKLHFTLFTSDLISCCVSVLLVSFFKFRSGVNVHLFVTNWRNNFPSNRKQEKQNKPWVTEEETL